MILFRARQWGQAEWTQIAIGGPENSEIDHLVASVLGSALSTSSLHVQMMAEEGEWEDIE